MTPIKIYGNAGTISYDRMVYYALLNNRVPM
jgi:hypothetical protein